MGSCVSGYKLGYLAATHVIGVLKVVFSIRAKPVLKVEIDIFLVRF
jgi:hypothetical protein